MIRLRQTHSNHCGDHHLVIKGFEIFGFLVEPNEKFSNLTRRLRRLEIESRRLADSNERLRQQLEGDQMDPSSIPSSSLTAGSYERAAETFIKSLGEWESVVEDQSYDRTREGVINRIQQLNQGLKQSERCFLQVVQL
jgi:hypothetical protein